MDRLEKFHLLEERIHQTIDWINRMEARYQSLLKGKQQLEEEVRDLRNHNNELAQEIVRLKNAREELTAKYGNQDEIKKRIDRMLEKFGELHI